MTRRVFVGATLALVALTALVLGQSSPLLRADLAAGRFFHSLAVDHPLLVRVADVGATVLSPSVFRVLVLALAGWLLWRGRAWLAFWAVLVMTVGGFAGLAGKQLTVRARPSFEPAVGHAAGYAYPSGHAINAALGVLVVLVAVVPLLRRRAARVAALVAGALVVVLTGLDRLVLGVHWTSDVVGAWLAAVVVAAGLLLVLRRKLDSASDRHVVRCPGAGVV